MPQAYAASGEGCAIERFARSREENLKKATHLLNELNEKLYSKRIGRRVSLTYGDRHGRPNMESAPLLDAPFHEFGWGRVHDKWQLFYSTGIYGEPETFSEKPLMEVPTWIRILFLRIATDVITAIESELAAEDKRLAGDIDRLEQALIRLG